MLDPASWPPRSRSLRRAFTARSRAPPTLPTRRTERRRTDETHDQGVARPRPGRRSGQCPRVHLPPGGRAGSGPERQAAGPRPGGRPAALPVRLPLLALRPLRVLRLRALPTARADLPDPPRRRAGARRALARMRGVAVARQRGTAGVRRV